MRALRMLPALLVVLALLGGLHNTVVAQDDGASVRPAIVSGYMHAPSSRWVGDFEFEDLWIVKHKETAADLQMDDPRLSGSLHLVGTYHQMAGASHDIFTGAARVTNDLGSWTGSMRGYDPATGLREWVVELSGQGGHESLSALLFFKEDPGTLGSNVVSGIIYVGGQPPMPETPVEG